MTDLPSTVDDGEAILIDDRIKTLRILKALHECSRARRIISLPIVDRGHREIPIQSDF